MQAPNVVRGYSDFFTSGFRAVTTRCSSSRRSSLEVAPTAPSSSTTRRTLLDITQRRRPASMLMQSATTKPIPHEKARGRRSSFVYFSSRLFDRKPWTTNNDENSRVSSSSRRSSRSSRFFSRSEDSIPEVWVTAGGPLTPSVPNGSSALHQNVDPFEYSPEARSTFIDLSSDSSPAETPKGESFLSFTTPSSNRSSHIFTRRERPTSIHTMPLPSRSRRSSIQYCPPVTTVFATQEKSDFFLILEEEPSLAAEPILEDLEWDAPAKMDWRQFHIDILTTDDTQ